MTGAPPLYILRHAETEWNATGRLQGRFDSALTPQGIAQARDQNVILSRADLAGFDAICSPQGRALATATIALENLISDIRTDDALREIGVGDWAGRDRVSLLATTQAVDGFDLYDLAPGGEGFAALHTRCGRFLRSLTAPAVLVTHGITSRMLRLILLGHDPVNLRDMSGGQGVVFYLEGGKQHCLSLGA